MTVTFRIEQLRLDTSRGPVTYSFPADLTVLAGQTGVGKTTLLELVKFGLGGEGLLAPVALQHVTDVHIDIHAGAARLQLSRALDPDSRRRVRVVDLITGERLPDHSVGGDEPTISDLLMTSLGLETGLKAAARSRRSTSAGAQITFNDVFRYMYVPQSEMNRDIGSSHDSYYAPKRKAVFELLFGLTSGDILNMRSEINTLKATLDQARIAYATVERFLIDSGTTSRMDAEFRETRARQDEREATASLSDLRSELAVVADRETQVLRDLLADAEQALSAARRLSTSLERERLEYIQERRRVVQDVTRLERMASAGERLANIEFSVCPRCTQSLNQRTVPSGTCRVCLQADIVQDAVGQDQYETQQLQSQIAEVDAQLEIIATQSSQVERAIGSREELVRSLTVQIDARTSNRVTPRLQAYADAVAKLTTARSEQASMEAVLRQWDRADDLRATADQTEARRNYLLSQVAARESTLSIRRSELISELDAEFLSTVVAFGIPSIEVASIDPESYLPMLNGQPFDEVSLAGGIITATQVAYWLTLVTVATRRGDTRVPAFLLLDSPRLALNTAEDIAAQMYRRFVTQVAVVPGRLQFIVADNQLPPEYGREFAELEFSYERPTVETVVHPGPAQVQTLGAAPEIEAVPAAPPTDGAGPRD